MSNQPSRTDVVKRAWFYSSGFYVEEKDCQKLEFDLTTERDAALAEAKKLKCALQHIATNMPHFQTAFPDYNHYDTWIHDFIAREVRTPAEQAAQDKLPELRLEDLYVPCGYCGEPTTDLSGYCCEEHSELRRMEA